MYMSHLTRGLALAAMTFALGLAMPGIAEASGAKARSAAERRQRPGLGYFANSPQNRAAVSSRSRTVRQPAFTVPSGAIVRRNVVRTPSQVVRRQVLPQRYIVGRPVVISERVVATQPVKKNEVEDSESAE